MSRQPSINSPVNEDVMNRTDMLTNEPDDVWSQAQRMVPPDPMKYASGSDAYDNGGSKNGKRK